MPIGSLLDPAIVVMRVGYRAAAKLQRFRDTTPRPLRLRKYCPSLRTRSF